MSNWRPVKDGMHGQVLVTVSGNGAHVLDVPGETNYLPDNLRLCERVPDEPITPEALRDAGWERSRWKNGYAYAVDIVDGLIFVDTWTNLIANEDCLLVNVQIEDSTRQCPNVQTMSDLRTLVRLLGGGA